MPTLWLPVGPWRFLPCPDCCGECDKCEGPESSQMQVEFSGWVDGNCANCDPDFNDTFVLDQDATNKCQYDYHFETSPCAEDNFYDVQLGFSKVGADYQVWVTLVVQTALEFYTFIKDYGGTKPDCDGLSGVSLPYNAGESLDNIGCDESGVTCTVTSL